MVINFLFSFIIVSFVASNKFVLLKNNTGMELYIIIV